MDFLQWWQAADYADKATVIGGIIGVLALLWAIFAYLVPHGIKEKSTKVTAENQSIAAGRDVKSNVTIGTPSDKT